MNDGGPTIGGLFSGVGGFELGFERAGFRVAWSVEWNELKRACLADRFPLAAHHGDVCGVGAHCLPTVDVLTAGFPCKDISVMGNSSKEGPQGLAGARSGLFWEALRVIREIRPRWVVIENVPQLLACNGSRDFEAVIRGLADCGYLGCFRVLDAAGFGVPARRERLYLVGRLGCQPPLSLLDDAGPVEGLSSAIGEIEIARHAHASPGYCLLAANARSRVSLGGQLLIAHENRWSAMDDRERMSASSGLPRGLDDPSLIEAHAAGDSVVPQVAEWIARKIRPFIK